MQPAAPKSDKYCKHILIPQQKVGANLRQRPPPPGELSSVKVSLSLTPEQLVQLSTLNLTDTRNLTSRILFLTTKLSRSNTAPHFQRICTPYNHSSQPLPAAQFYRSETRVPPSLDSTEDQTSHKSRWLSHSTRRVPQNASASKASSNEPPPTSVFATPTCDAQTPRWASPRFELIESTPEMTESLLQSWITLRPPP